MPDSSPRSPAQLQADALAIWHAGVAAVQSERLVREAVLVEGDWLHLGEETLHLPTIRRIVVVGGGKAGAGMAQGLEEALGPKLLAEKQVSGWVNVPADCVRQLSTIHLHPARPAGQNEPTLAGAQGTAEILRMVGELGPDDLVICLISGGGSALLPAPVPEISLAEKVTLTRFLSAEGANITQLNTVRKCLSQIKGGGLARACRAGRLISLIISDVIGDPLEIIASGPTILQPASPSEALAVLRQFDPHQTLPKAIYGVLMRPQVPVNASPPNWPVVSNLILGNNAVAVDAAGIEAERRGYSHAMTAARTLEGEAEGVGRHLAEMAHQMRTENGPDCLITGGEPIVQLAPVAIRGLGGRNQQLVLAAFQRLLELSADSSSAATTNLLANPFANLALLSGGTDGEDGPTDAAGAILDSATFDRWRQLSLDPADYLRRRDAYHFWEPLGNLIKTGPTHTNVCDLRVVCVARRFER